ncbi:hypothetical protein B0A48_09412 [Cryoendolithus antarcticus]|uniref:Major facilitator superfamily (MFS) profile domain-containing protein n=1 Tax=Cryoendolithus antarcticus TaxID=1507870 RepID=A0A1V8SZI5_9PEZI|nr:hypothetical protein B0A48_09412 [Cryoendolithus antarcticus]
MSLEKASYLDCFRGNIGKRLLTAVSFRVCSDLLDNFIFYHGTQYFQNAGFEDPFIISVITNCVNVFLTFPGLYLVEKLGRRNLLLLGASGMAVCQFIVAITAAIAFVCIYIYFFASTWGPVAWVVTGEIFPLKARAKCLSMTTATNWLLNFAIAYATPYMVCDGPGYANLQSKIFFIWGGCCFICIIFTWFLIYETKGLSLEQVDELYQTVNKAWESKKLRPQISFHEVSDIKNDGRAMSLAEIGAEVQRKKSVGHEENL